MLKKKKKKADVADVEAEGAEETKKSGGGLVSKLAMLVALGAASFGTVYLLPRPDIGAPAADHAADAHVEEEEEDIDLHVETTYLELNPMTISLQENMRILKIGITLETVSGYETEIDPNDPKIRDAFMGYLRALRLDEVQDAAFMAQMRAQLLRRAQLVLGHEKIHGILITDFLVR